tara:strand:+ start:2234 stop:2695 length:462 start_codon:yes stop_codon:yes gene_type:complete
MTIETIKHLVETETGIELDNQQRNRKNVYARAIYFKLCRERTGLSLQRIGKTVNKHHASVLYSINNTFPELYKYSKDFKESYENILDNNALIPLKEKYNTLNQKYKIIKKRLEFNIDEDLQDIIKQIPNSQLESAKIKIDAMVQILKSIDNKK